MKKNFNLKQGEKVSAKIVPKGTKVKTVNRLVNPGFCLHVVPAGTVVTIADEQGCFRFEDEWRFDKEYVIV